MLREFCRTSGFLRALLTMKYVLKVLFLLIPIIIIVMVIVNLFKAAISGNAEDDLKKLVPSTIKRLVAGVIVFLIPSLITYAFTLTGENFYDLRTCIERATLEEVNYYEKVYEPANILVEKLEQNPVASDVDNIKSKIASYSGLRGEDKEDLLARIDAAENKTDEYIKKIQCKNEGGIWVDNQCKKLNKPVSSSTTGVESSTGENGEYYYEGNGNDGGTIDYNGYDVIQSAVSVNDYLKIVSSNRIGQNNDSSVYGGYCLAFSYIHAYSLYSGDTSGRAPDALNYKYAGKFKTYIDSKEQILAVTYTEIKKGRPVIIQVNGNKEGTSRHFVTVVGVKKGVTASTIQETDLLIIDSWDGKLETMNGKGSGTRFLTSGADCHKDYSGYRIQYLK